MKNSIKFLTLTLLLTTSFCFNGCNNTEDNNSKYFNTEESIMIPKLISTEKDSTFETISKNIAPAVVAVSNTTDTGIGVGSGVCVYSGGYILTNAHVVANSKKLTLYLYNGTTANAILLWRDSNMDIAILKSDVALPYLPINNNEYSVGEDVLAVGTPLNLIFTHTYTKGIISAVDRTLELESEYGVSYMQNLIQHDASINPGNSGGPLINSSGEIVGINTLKVSTAEGLGFAIPSKSFKNVINQVVKDKEYQTPYFGIMGYDASIAVYYGANFNTTGVYVKSVDINSPAYIAGIRNGDIITSFNNVTINNMLDLKSELYNCTANTTVNVELIRENNILTTTCTLLNKS